MATLLGSSSTELLASPAARLDTLPPWPWGWADRDAPRTIGWHVIAWGEGGLGEFHADQFRGLIQPNGPRARQRFKFTPRQRAFLLWWYSLDDNGRWLFHHGARRLAKGSGKSPFAAVFALAEFCAPVRFERFDDRMPGGCRGRPVDMPLVQIAATAESQTANTMRMVRAFAPKGSHIVEHYQLDPGKTIYYRQPEGALQVITSSVTAAEGAEASAIVADETEHWKPANQGPALSSTLIDNLAKSGSRMLETSNAWETDQSTVAESTFDAWVAQEEGLLRGDTKILYDAVIAPPETDLADPESLDSSLRGVFSDCWWQDLEPIKNRIWSPNASVSEIQRKYLNWPSASDDKWFDRPEEWHARADFTKVVEEREMITLGFDGSRSRVRGATDASAIEACRLSDGHVFQPVDPSVWEQPTNWPRHEPWRVPVEEIDTAIDQIFATYDVVAFYADPAKWETYVAAWEAKYGARLKVKATRVHPIEWWMTGGRSGLVVRATRQFYDAVVNSEMTHDGSSALTRHVLNAHIRNSPSGIQIRKENPDSTRKIDAAVAGILAWQARLDALAHGVGNTESFVPRRIR